MVEYKEKNCVATSAPSYKLQHTMKKIESDSKKPFVQYRYIIAFIGFLIYLLLSVQRAVMSVAIVAMVNNTAINHQSDVKSDSCPSLMMNQTEDKRFDVIKKQEGEFVWATQIQGYVLGSYYFGFIISQIPVGILAERYGCKWFLISSSLSSSVLSLLVPPVSLLSPYALIVVQTMRGLAQGLVQPSMLILISNWFPKSERGILCAFILTSSSLGSFIGYIFTGYMCELPTGWSYTFYTVGIAELALSISIIFSLAESPKVHPKVSKVELDFILSNQESTLNQKRPKQPWKSMLMSIPVQTYAFAFFGYIWAISHFRIVQSTFLGTILHYPIAENGIFTAIPFLVQFIFNQIGTWITLFMQKNNLASNELIRKLWICISGMGYTGCLLGMYFAGCHRILSIIFGILSVGLIALGLPSFSIVSTDLTPTFAGSLQALISTISYTSSVILPVIVGYLTHERQTIEQWNKVFFITIGVVVFSYIVFVIFGSAEVQPWNFVEEKTQNKVEEQTESFKKNSKNDKDEETACF